MPVSGNYGTPTNPNGDIYSSHWELQWYTGNDPAHVQGDMWGRSDVAPGNSIATIRVDHYQGSGVWDIPVFPSGSAEVNVLEKEGIETPNGTGFVPITDYHPTYPNIALRHSGSTFNLHDSNYGIPESEADSKLIHRWILNHINGTVEDVVGNEDGTVNGVASVDGAWAGGRAGDGDGSNDYISTGTWGSFGSNTTGEFAIGLSFSTTTTNSFTRYVGVSMADSQVFDVMLTDRTAAGQIELRLRDADGDDINAHTDNTFNDGNQYRLVAQKTGAGASDFEFWLNQSQENMTVINDNNYDNVSDFSRNVFVFAQNDGSANSPIDAIIDDICVFNGSLTQTEIQSYTNPWS